LFLVSLLTDNKLQEKFGTCSTSWMVNRGDKTIEPFPATAKREPAATLVFKFLAHGLYEENKLDSPVM